MSIFMEDYFEEEDYLANIPVIECADDPVTAMYRIAYEGELNYKKIEEAVGIALEQAVNEAGSDIKAAAKAKFDVVLKTLKKCVNWVKQQFQKIIGAVAKFITDKWDAKFDELCQKTVNHMKGNTTLRLKKAVTAYDYNMDKAQANFNKALDEVIAMTSDTTSDKDANDKKIKNCYIKIGGNKVENASTLAEALRKESRGEKRIEMKTCNVSQFQKLASTFRKAKNDVKVDYNGLKKGYNQQIRELNKQIVKVNAHAVKNGGKDADDKKIIAESNNLISCIREAIKIIQIAKANVMETISGYQNVVKALAHACLNSESGNIADKAQVGEKGYKSKDSIGGSKKQGPARDLKYVKVNGKWKAEKKNYEESSIADIFGIALNEDYESDDLFDNIEFI